MKCEVFKKLIRSLLSGVLIFHAHLGLTQTICSIDTLSWPFAGNDTLYSSEPLGSPGYVSGHNGYIQSSTAEFISNNNTISVTGALIRFGHAETADSTSIVTISIWDSSGTDYTGAPGAPGNILISKDALITDIANDVNNAVLTEITFDSSITLTEGFYMGMQITLLPDTTNVPGDTVAIITNTDGETVPATAWAEYPFFNGWWNFQPGWFLDVSLAVFPITNTSINASFTASADTVDLAVSGDVIFTNTSLGATNWYWWFGDGDTSTAIGPPHIYDSVGTYTVTLVASLGSCTDTAWTTINVICPAFSAGFTQSAGSIDVSSSVTFTDTTTGATSWYWWFGDGDTSTAMSPTHTYNSMGSFNVQLVAWTGSCSSDTVWSTIIVNDTTTSINELTVLGTFSIFPNPTEGVINITFNAHELQPISIKVYDLRGSLISETIHDLMNLPAGQAGGYCTIDLSKQASGTYLVQIVTRNRVVSQKVRIIEQ